MKQPTEREIIRALGEAQRLIRELQQAKRREQRQQAKPHEVVIPTDPELALADLMQRIERVHHPHDLLDLRDFVNEQVERVVPRVQQEAHAASSNGHVFGQRR